MSAWKIDKKVPLVVLITLASYLMIGISYAVYLKADVEHVKESMERYKSLPERFGRLEQKIDDMQLTLNIYLRDHRK